MNETTLTNASDVYPGLPLNITIHTEGHGTQGPFQAAQGMWLGSAEESRRLEGVKIQFPQDVGLKILGKVFGRKVGEAEGLWRDEVDMSRDWLGVIQDQRQMECISLRLDGPAKDKYSIAYTVHQEAFNDLEWRKDGDGCGRGGKRIEGIIVVVVPTGTSLPVVQRVFVDRRPHRLYLNSEQVSWNDPNVKARVSADGGRYVERHTVKVPPGGVLYVMLTTKGGPDGYSGFSAPLPPSVQAGHGGEVVIELWVRQRHRRIDPFDQGERPDIGVVYFLGRHGGS